MTWSHFWIGLGIYSTCVVLAFIFGAAFLSKHSIGPYE